MYAAKKAMISGGVSLPALLDPNNPDILGMWLNGTPISGATLFDDTSNGNDGTITGATEVAGHDGIALRFDASTEKVDMGNVINITTGDFSIWSLIKTSDATKNKSIVQKRIDPNPDGYFLSVQTGGTVAAGLQEGVSSVTISSVGTVNNGAYHFLGCNFDRSLNGTIYIDAVADGSASIAGVSSSISNAGEFTIGNKSAGITTSLSDFIGDIDITLVMNRLATTTEIDEAVAFLGL
jgi:hypothetical protein